MEYNIYWGKFKIIKKNNIISIYDTRPDYLNKFPQINTQHELNKLLKYISNLNTTQIKKEKHKNIAKIIITKTVIKNYIKNSTKIAITHVAEFKILLEKKMSYQDLSDIYGIPKGVIWKTLKKYESCNPK